MICLNCHARIPFLKAREYIRCEACGSLLHTNFKSASMKALYACAVVAPLAALLVDRSFGWVFSLVSTVIGLCLYVFLLPRFLSVVDWSKGIDTTHKT